MATYYDEDGKVLGRAWSAMVCNKVYEKEEHKPHSHNPQFAIYGPYMCEGFPKVKLFDTKPRKSVN